MATPEYGPVVGAESATVPAALSVMPPKLPPVFVTSGLSLAANLLTRLHDFVYS